MLGEGIVSLGVCPSSALSRRNSNASAKIVCGSEILSGTSSARGVAELDVDALALHLANSAERVDEVHVPGGAAKLAIGDGLQPGGALQLDHASDRFILGATQGGRVDAPGLELGAGVLHLGGTQQAADMVGAKGWLGTQGHGSLRDRLRRGVRGPD